MSRLIWIYSVCPLVFDFSTLYNKSFSKFFRHKFVVCFFGPLGVEDLPLLEVTGAAVVGALEPLVALVVVTGCCEVAWLVFVGVVTGTPVLDCFVALVLISGAFVLVIFGVVGGCVGATVDELVEPVTFTFVVGTVVDDFGVATGVVLGLVETALLALVGASVILGLDVFVLLSSGVATVTVGIGFGVVVEVVVLFGETAPG